MVYGVHVSETRDYRLLADYYQFYVEDDEANADWTGAWTDETVLDGAVAVPGAIVVRTARDQWVPVRLSVLDAEPPLELEGSDHAVEASVEVRSGRLVVAGCTDDFRTADRITVQPGSYRVRVLYRNIDPATASDAAEDSYELLLWPGSAQPARVLKRHTGPPVR